MIRRFSIGFLLVCLGLAAQSAWSEPAPVGLPESITHEVKYSGLPAGSYLSPKSWPAVQMSHTVGHAVADPDARGGKAWEALVDRDGGSAYMLYGPYVELARGDYVAFFRIKMLDEPGDEVPASIDTSSNHGTQTLAVRDILSGELTLGQYVQVPIAFRYESGPLELRLMWNANTSLRVDSITLFRLDGGNVANTGVPMVAQPVGSGDPHDLIYRKAARPFPEIFPKSTQPSPRLLVCDLQKSSTDWRMLAICLQGIVNREKPQVYCLSQSTDQFWLDWMLKRKWIKSTEPITPVQLVNRYKSQIKGMIIIDPLLPATKNVATMLAGVENGIVVSPRLAKQLSMPTIADLRGRWTTNADAYRWAFDNLWSRMNHHVAACLWPNSVGVRDYLVQNKLFVFWLPGRIDGVKKYANPDAEVRFVEELLSRMPANIPVMGYPYAGLDVGMGEGGGVGLMAEFGKYLVGSVDCTNISVHSGIKVPAFKQRSTPTPKLQNGKVYIAFTISDGDNLPVMSIANWPQVWSDRARGQFPVGWTISPSSGILIPDIMDYYYSTATPNDTFQAAVSGVGYTYLNVYGKRYREADRSAIINEFMQQTDTYMKKMDMSIVCPSGVGLDEIRRYAERIPSAKAIFADYGRNVSSYEDATHSTARNLPVFHAVTMWDPQGSIKKQVETMVSQIKQMTPAKDRPAFMHVFVCNWFWNLPAMKEVLKQLGPEYVAVSPENLGALYLQEMDRQKVQVRAPSSLAAIEGRPISLSIPIQNVSQSPMHLQVKAADGLSNATVTPSVANVLPGQEFTTVLTGVPTGDSVSADVTGTFGTRKASVSVKRVALSEMVGTLPAEELLFAKSYDAIGMAHNAGSIASDGGHTVMSAVAGKDKPGHLVFGPYKPLAAGRYAAIFRMKRTSEGTGVVCTLDTCVAAAPKSTAVREVMADELPMNEYRSVLVVFDHPGGNVETRVAWQGSASLSVDRIDLFQVAQK